MTRLSINLLGSFQVQRDGVLVTRFRSNKVRALLAYLAVAGDQPLARTVLAGLLWPEQGDSQALRNLSQALLRLSQALGELPLHVSRQAIQWRSDAAEVDVRVFEQLARSSETADLAQAAALYRGELLAGFNLPNCEAFEEWLLLARERLLQQALAALHTLTEQHLAAGRLTHAAASARRQIELDVWREQAHRQLMRALALAGDRGAALAQYAACCQALEAGLGIEPDAATHALYEQIRTGAVPDRETWRHGDTQQERHVSVSPALPVSVSPHHEWSEAPEPGRFYGRAAEIAQLSTWLIDERCQLVAILGIGGMGKTSLAATLVQTLAGHFEHVIWRSLLNAPPLEELLRPLLQSLSGQALVQVPTSLDDQLALLLDYLRRARCLLILDNLESLLTPDGIGQMRAGYEGYAHLIGRLAHSKHQSCLLLTSREQPQGMARWQADLEWVRTLRLAGLDPAASQAILSARGLPGQEPEARELARRYSGHPLALKLVAETVQELFGGAIGSFLREETLFFDDIRTLLDQQFARLSALEQEILFWLAVEREPVAAAALRDNMVHKPAFGLYLEALRALQRRSLLEQHAQGFTLQNVLIEYLTARLIDGVCAELLDADTELGRPRHSKQLVPMSLINRFALFKARAKEYVRQSQTRLILQPVAERLVAQRGPAALAAHMQTLLAGLRETAARAPGYAAGNLLNLLLHLRIDVSGYDFSRLSVWQADLRGVARAALDFNQADLANTLFTLDFSTYAIRLEQSGQVTVAAPFKEALSLWRLINGQLHDGFHIPNLKAYPLVFSPDGRFLAGCCADHSVRIWLVETGAQLHCLQGHTAVADSLAFSHDTQLLSSTGLDRSIRVWDVGSGHCVQILSQQHLRSRVLAFQPERTATSLARARLLASAGSDQTIWLWDLQSGRVVDILHEHTREIQSLAFSPDGTRLASGAHDGTILLWDVRRAGHAALLGALAGHSNLVRVLAFHPDSQLLASGGADQTIRLWDTRDGRPRQILTGHMSEVGHLSFRPDGQVLASCSADRVIKLWDVQTGGALDSLNGYINTIYAVRFRPDGRQLASGGADGLIRLWDHQQGRLERSFQVHAGPVLAVAFSPDGRLLASGGADTTIRIWDAATGNLMQTLRGQRGAVTALAWSRDGRLLASAGKDRTIRLWPAVEGAVVSESRGRVIDGHTDEVVTLAFGPDGRSLLSGSHDHSLRLWDSDTGAQIAVLNGHSAALAAAAFSPTGDQVASIGYDDTLYVWDVATGQYAAGWDGINAAGRVVAFSPHAALLAYGSAEMTLVIRDLSSRATLHTLRGHTSTIIGLDWSPTEPVLASCAWDGTIRLWDVGIGVCLYTLRAPGPYAGMNIAGATGISDAQKTALKALGAVVEEPGENDVMGLRQSPALGL